MEELDLGNSWAEHEKMGQMVGWAGAAGGFLGMRFFSDGNDLS
jgi:hypothetical protein